MLLQTDPTKPHLYIIRGIPGTGKSTLASEIEEYKFADLSLEADMYFYRRGVYEYNKEYALRAIWLSETMAKSVLRIGVPRISNVRGNDALPKGKRAIVSAIFASQVPLERLISRAMDPAIGAGVTVVDCVEQHANVHNVPANVMDRLKIAWQPYKDAVSPEAVREEIRHELELRLRTKGGR